MHFGHNDSTVEAGFTDNDLLDVLEKLNSIGVAKTILFNENVFQDFDSFKSRLPANVEIRETNNSTNRTTKGSSLSSETEELKKFYDSDSKLRTLPMDHPAIDRVLGFLKDTKFERSKPKNKRLILKPSGYEINIRRELTPSGRLDISSRSLELSLIHI